LNGLNIIAFLGQIVSKAVSQGINRSRLGDASPLNRFFNGPLKVCRMDMVTADNMSASRNLSQSSVQVSGEGH